MSLKKFQKLEITIQTSLKEKLAQIAESSNKGQIRSLVNFYPATHRLRIGEYRLILRFDDSLGHYIVLDIGHRRDIYR